MDVLRDLASMAGVELDERPLSPAERQARQKAESERERMFRAMELAAAFFEEQYAGARRRSRARLRREARDRRRRARALPRRLRARPLGRAVVAPGRQADPRLGHGAPGPGRRQRARPLRLLPRPGDAAGARSAEARDRIRRAAARSRRQGPQVRQLAGLAALSQEGAALRPARRAGRDPAQRAARSWSRGTSTCWPCTRPASRRRWRPWARR